MKIRLYKKYILLLPETLKYKELYLQCNTSKQIRKTGKWYKDRSLGINTISSTVKELTGDLVLERFYTNHSLRHSCGTILHNNDVPDQVIREHTGHRSDAINGYRHTSKATKCKVSSLFNDSVPLEHCGDVSPKEKGVLRPLKLYELKAMRDGTVDLDESDENVKNVKFDITVNIKK